jgi:phosphoglycerate-specific signal transduction histidine kinase
MVREHYTATVREDSKGQKTVTVPKHADVKGGEEIKFKKTKNWGHQESIDAIKKAQKEAAKHWYDKDDDLAPEKIGGTNYVCTEGGKEPCGWTELRESEIKEHLREEHGIPEGYEEDHYIQQEHIGIIDLTRLLPMIVRNLDIENKDLHADEVVDKIEGIIEGDYTDPIIIEKIHDYINEIREEHIEQ